MIKSSGTAQRLLDERLLFAERSSEWFDLRHAIFEELCEHPAYPDQTSPTRLGNWWYFVQRVPNTAYAMFLRLPLQNDGDLTPPDLADPTIASVAEVVIDDSVEAEGADFYVRSHTDISRDGSIVAYSLDKTGDEMHHIRVVSMASERVRIDSLLNVYPQFLLHPDGTKIYYLTTDEKLRPNTLWMHRIGTQRDQDQLLCLESDERFWLTIAPTRSGRYLRLVANAHHSTECAILDLSETPSSLRTVRKRTAGSRYLVDHLPIGQDDLLILVHSEGDDDFSVSLMNSEDLGTNRCTTLSVRVSGVDVNLTEVQPFNGYLALGFRHESLSGAGILLGQDVAAAAKSGLPLEVIKLEPLPPPATIYLGDNPAWDNPVLKINGTSLTTPLTVYGYDVEGSQISVVQSAERLGRFETSEFEEVRLWVEADDAAMIPVSVVAPRVRPETGAPFVVYAYGAYGVPSDPSFSPGILSLLKRGIGYAIIHVRGGGEAGALWHRAGTKLLKENSFSDYEAGIAGLVKLGYADSEKIIGEGSSAGGLLIAAVGNRRRSLLKGMLVNAPFVDPLTTLSDPTLPLTISDWEEFGNPLESQEMFALIRSYSPAQNVGGERPPAALATIGAEDSRVDPNETFRWVDSLRTAGGDALILPTAAGHSGETGDQALQTLAHQYAWAVRLLES